MRKLTSTTTIGSKRKHPSNNQANENSNITDAAYGSPIESSRSAVNSKPLIGVFQSSLSTPLSIVTNGFASNGCITNDNNMQIVVVEPESRPIEHCRNLMHDFQEVVEPLHDNMPPNNGYYFDIGDPDYVCEHCNSFFWYNERSSNSKGSENPKYSACCVNGKIKLPLMTKPPQKLHDLFFRTSDKNKCFLKNIRSYNNMFCFTSMGGKIDRTINNGTSPPIFRINGQNFHRIGSLVPSVGIQPKFAQLYIHDTENEIENRFNSLRAQNNGSTLHVEVVHDIKQTLDEHNVLVKSFRMAKSFIESNPQTQIRMRLIGKMTKDARTYALPTTSEVAALIVGDIDPYMGQRDIIVESRSRVLKRISELNPAYLPLQYPILFPYGEDGFREDIHFATQGTKQDFSRKSVSQREYFAFRIHERSNEISTIMYAKRLFQQFLVDAYTMVESSRLLYIRLNQKALRCEAYKGLSDALTRGEVQPVLKVKESYYHQVSLEEQERFLEKRNLKAEDRPDIVCRVFKMKLDCLIKEIKNGKLFGRVKAVIYTIEFQKRGLPHAHILLFLQANSEFADPAFMDTIISAEIPDKVTENEYYKHVGEFMLHGPCGAARMKSPCMANGKCSKHFPKRYIDASHFDQDGYPLSIKYLFKYVNKGNDRVTVEFYKATIDGAGNEIVDEINMYYDCRYVSACEATWRLFSFEVQYRTPPVERLSFHLPDYQSVVFQDDDTIDNVLNRETVGQSMFNAWFVANQKFKEASLLTYIEMPTKFVWKKDIREWHPRKKGSSIGRIFYVPPASGEIYYFRCLLNIVRGPTSYKDIRTVNGVEYLTFRDACYAHGLLDDDKEYIDAINEASYWSSAHSLRKLFVVLLTSSSIIRPENVWNQVWEHLSEDAQHYQRRVLKQQDLVLTEEEKKNFALIELENLLELSYDSEQLKADSEVLRAKLTEEQGLIYDTVIKDIENKKGGLFFVYGYGGTGKTFLWRALSAAVRCKGRIVLNVASSGIASLLLPGGRTAHSRFAIPIAINEDSTCNIKQGSDLAELLIKTSLIIWDEAPMMHKHFFEALDRTMRDLLRFVEPNSEMKTFGGKTVVLGGDFRQILPVVPKGTWQDIVSSAINSSYLWDSCKVLRLTKNLRLSSVPNCGNRQALQEFADWIANIGDGKIGGQNNGFAEIEMPMHMLVSSGGDDIKAIVHSTFPMFASGNTDPEHLLGRAILAPTLDVVNAVNDYMTELHNAESRSYYSSDAVCKAGGDNGIFGDVHTPEFLNSIRVSGLPNHTLTLKIGSPVMLMRNIDHSLGLCNGTRLIITKLADHVIEGEILTGPNKGTKVLIPRMSMAPSDPRLPFKFQRRQFLLMLSYAMTINKSQGQTLTHVGLVLKKPVFVHGQLYVAASRVNNPDGLKILIAKDSSSTTTSTTNVVYHEVLNNL
ncbi:PREDICTED: uncharacterized protein LOC109170955 [Ipomoea nil]|uniref:uncharacterized protein LOC109170955 n=1 Tax=Ipomoea nil TaxID=35883 RepID=UPI0009018F72|nr:PREDICTED: uncharacterized protein LOC109170955 [Ipomoea nil]